ncbi:hypothetical protein ACFPYJ_29310 [Paenibacillus solisilvae]|uniref:Uncharacterized protein n=1 Tax=Paenibacillus solisilvae TaxID=2486751 RepID=A0ABW0W629_9BACL
MDHFYIRHSVGSSLLFDSKKHDGSYSIEPAGEDGYTFIIHSADDALAELLLLHCNELNLFVVPQENPHQKIWYYSTDGLVEFDKAAQQIIIRTDRQLGYSV